jgi:predicted metal-binding membrane protein
MQTAPNPLTSVPQLPARERLLTLAELGGLTALAWIYLVRMPMSPGDLGGVLARLAAPMPSQLVDAWLTFMMWAVMMVAMMLPSASPMILMYARIARGREHTSAWGTWLFALGYVVVWTLFSVAATVLQIGLHAASIISNASIATPIAGAAILIATGVYQLTPLKQACLGNCQSPMSFFMTRWRDGASGAFRLGLEHGFFCVGCCWMLMGLLFVAGVMNLAWVAAISALVLIEKVVPYPRAIANVAGVALIIGGIVLGARGLTA